MIRGMGQRNPTQREALIKTMLSRDYEAADIALNHLMDDSFVPPPMGDVYQTSINAKFNSQSLENRTSRKMAYNPSMKPLKDIRKYSPEECLKYFQKPQGMCVVWGVPLSVSEWRADRPTDDGVYDVFVLFIHEFLNDFKAPGKSINVFKTKPLLNSEKERRGLDLEMDDRRAAVIILREYTDTMVEYMNGPEEARQRDDDPFADAYLVIHPDAPNGDQHPQYETLYMKKKRAAQGLLVVMPEDESDVEDDLDIGVYDEE